MNVYVLKGHIGQSYFMRAEVAARRRVGPGDTSGHSATAWHNVTAPAVVCANKHATVYMTAGTQV